jgi:hypothetical protein
MNTIIVRRLFAVVVFQIATTVGVASVFGVELWKAAAIAVLTEVAGVVRDLAKGYLTDGQLSQADIDNAFQQVKDNKAL